MSEEKPEIEYPCDWEYKVIGLSEAAVRQAAVDAFAQRDYNIEFSHVSSTGKYHSYSITCSVQNEDDRNTLFGLISGAKDIMTVI